MQTSCYGRHLFRSSTSDPGENVGSHSEKSTWTGFEAKEDDRVEGASSPRVSISQQGASLILRSFEF